jgi:anti-sigma factor RsiW
MTHLTDTQLQGLADGTLRGPEGMAAREHCEDCGGCGAELALYAALAGKLSALRDPEPPADFTATVLAAAEARETQLVQRRHTLLAALPAAAMAIVAIVGWALSAQVNRIIDGVMWMRLVVGVLSPVVETVRVPLVLGALAFVAVVLAALSRTLRPGHRVTTS